MVFILELEVLPYVWVFCMTNKFHRYLNPALVRFMWMEIEVFMAWVRPASSYKEVVF